MGHTDLKTSLQHLTEKYLHVLISKGSQGQPDSCLDPKIRCGNWDLDDLSEDQIKYAAGDSYYSREVFVYFYNLYCSSMKDSQPLSALEWSLVNHMEVHFMRCILTIRSPSSTAMIVINTMFV